MNTRSSIANPGESIRIRKHTLVAKTALVSLVVIGTNVFANYALTRGLREVGVVESWSPWPYVEAFSKPWVAVGVIFMAVWLITRLALLSWADLTYVLPVTSFSYVLSAAVGAIWINEQVSALRWLAVGIITLGILLVLLTYPNTTRNPQQDR